MVIVCRVVGRHDSEFVRHGCYSVGDSSDLDEFPNVYLAVTWLPKAIIAEASKAKRFAAAAAHGLASTSAAAAHDPPDPDPDPGRWPGHRMAAAHKLVKTAVQESVHYQNCGKLVVSLQGSDIVFGGGLSTGSE